MAARPDFLSTMSEMPVLGPTEQRNEKNLWRRNADGSISLIPLEEVEEVREIEVNAPPDNWHENLADALSPNERMSIADEVIEYYDLDEQVREQHFDRLREGLKLLGLEDTPQSDVPFNGASTVQHPVIAEAITQFQARAIEEMFPANGPVKAKVVGDMDDERQKQAKRIEDYMNYQLTEEDEEYFESTDQMLFYLPLSGSAFKKVCPDPITGMTTSRFVTAEDLIVPYHAKSLRNTSRYCHRYDMWENDVLRAQDKGTFIKDARLTRSPQIIADKNVSFGQYEMEDVADDRTPQQHYDDIVYTILEYHIDYRMPWDKDADVAPPYIISVEKDSREVLSIRRNWKHGDETKRKRIWFIHYKFLPGLGFYGFGYLHIIGALANAASGAIRALLDSAAIANMQGGFKAKEARIAGETRFTPGEWKDVDMTAEELENAFFNLPVREPSTALAQLATMLVEEGRRFATTTENMVGDADNRGPVGTTIALIEQGSKVFSAVHKRMHRAARAEFKRIAETNFEFMEVEKYPYQIHGERREVLKQDFDGRVDVIPVSDPNIWSSTQRIALAQAAVELTTSDPEVYNLKQRKEAHRRMIEALRLPEPDKIQPKVEDEKPIDPVSENMSFMVGNPSQVFANQDHEAHIAIHMNFAQTQAAKNPEIYKNIDPVVQAHIMEHEAWLYRQQVEADLGIPLPEFDLNDPTKNEDLPEEVERMISRAVARKLRPPPPPAPDPAEQEELAEAEQKENMEDAKVISYLQREDAKAKQKLAQEDEAHKAEEKRTQDSFLSEERRKDRESSAEIRRKDREAKAAAKAKKPEGGSK